MKTKKLLRNIRKLLTKTKKLLTKLEKLLRKPRKPLFLCLLYYFRADYGLLSLPNCLFQSAFRPSAFRNRQYARMKAIA
ncbi:MAG: hypothetical protein DMF68_19335 [Acidobacteria bacterium]|nr:MAG: hypothetical protein DMF68_19335 [Acidobacteriota bacterium]